MGLISGISVGLTSENASMIFCSISTAKKENCMNSLAGAEKAFDNI